MNTKSPFLTGLSILLISILCNEAMTQTVDTLPSFRNFCTGHTEKPDTVLYYYDAGDSRKTRIIANDTTITDTYYINAYERWIVENGVTIKFRDYVQLVVNGGTLIVGKPKPRWASDPDSSTIINGLRSLTGECTCDQVVLKIDDGNTCWGGIRAKTGTLYMYGTTIYDAKTGLTVADTGDPYYCFQSVASPPPFVWMECCKIQQPPDTGFTFNGLEWAGIHLKGNGASQTIITRTRIDCASRYVWGVRVDGGKDGNNCEWDACRAPRLSSILITDATRAGVELIHTNDGCNSTYTEVVANSIRAEACKIGIRLNGKVKMRFTECEGGLDAIAGEHGYMDYGIRLTSDYSCQDNKPGMYFNEKGTRLYVHYADTAGIFGDHESEVIDSCYLSFVFLENGFDDTKPQIRTLGGSRVILSTHDTLSYDTLRAHRRDMIHSSSDNLLEADASSTIKVKYAFWGAETTNYTSTYPPATSGKGTFIVGDKNHDDTTRSLLAKVCVAILPANGDTTASYIRYISRLDQSTTEKNSPVNAFPNPFNPSVSIAITLNRAEEFSLHIFDIYGRLVKSLAENEYKLPGVYFFRWDGQSEKDVASHSGLYFVVFTSSNAVQAQRIFLTK